MLYKTVKRPSYKWFKIKNFPYISKKRSTKKHTAVIGVGGNVGDTKRRVQKLFVFFKRGTVFDILQTSPILKNPPFGYLEQDDFFNAVIVVKTNLTPLKLLKELQRVEKRFKRVRVFKNSPRTLDLDIIFYDKITVNKPDLTIPHPRYRERDSVLLPLYSLKRRVI